jgi:hypothetical protein
MSSLYERTERLRYTIQFCAQFPLQQDSFSLRKACQFFKFGDHCPRFGDLCRIILAKIFGEAELLVALLLDFSRRSPERLA